MSGAAGTPTTMSSLRPDGKLLGMVACWCTEGTDLSYYSQELGTT